MKKHLYLDFVESRCNRSKTSQNFDKQVKNRLLNRENEDTTMSVQQFAEVLLLVLPQSLIAPTYQPGCGHTP